MRRKFLIVLALATLVGACATSTYPPDHAPGAWAHVDEAGGVTVYHPYPYPPADPGFGTDPWGWSPYRPGFTGYYVDPFWFSRYYYTVPIIPPGSGVVPRPPPPAKPPPPAQPPPRPRPPPVTPRPPPPSDIRPTPRPPKPESPRVREQFEKPNRQ